MEYKFKDSIINKRFKLVFEDLLKHRLVESKNKFAQQLGTYCHAMNEILVGKRKPTTKQIRLVAEIYGINTNYIFGFSDVMYRKDSAEFPRQYAEAIGQFVNAIDKVKFEIQKFM